MFRFQEWKVYKDARVLRLEIEKEVLPKLPKLEIFSLSDQLRRAMNSVILNIAEGSYRKSDKDFAHFLNQSITSLYEVVSCLDLIYDSKYIEKELHNEFLEKCENVARQINAFSKHLYKK